MEATGVYWKPVWHLREDRFERVLANAQHVRKRVESLRGHVTPIIVPCCGCPWASSRPSRRRCSRWMPPWEKAWRRSPRPRPRLQTMPGVSEVVAHVIVAEIGVDMSRFPSAAHLISWAGLCPRNDESAGKRRSTRVRKSGTWLKTTLVTAAWAAARTRNPYLPTQFLRIKSRRGAKKAILAVAASMLTAAYSMLRDGVEYRDLGADHYDRRDRSRAISRLVRRLHHLGCQVEIKHAA